ncbi:ATP-binding protein [Quadrisphaera sp. KR29]|uniref:ATP-binding protein n=1 Tax=Quadrisphaera sp. KR29 TaxID=3461391 RepID=UPI0040446A9B
MRRPMPLGPQLLALQALIVLSAVVIAGVAAVSLQQRQIRQAYGDQMVAVARNAATLPDVVEAYEQPGGPGDDLQDLATLLQQASQVSFVVFLDRDGIRLSHPDPSLIGSPSTTSAAEVLRGEEFLGTQTGTLGPSLRAKVPVRDASGRILGAVSVGIVESELADDFTEDVPWLAAWLGGAAVLGSVGSYLLTRLVRRRIMGLEPDEIARLLQAREAMLHGIREGVLAVDERGRVVLVNDEACRLLDLDSGHGDDGGGVVGSPAAGVLDPAALALLEADDDAVDAPLLVGERVLLASRTPALVHGRRVGRVLTVRDRTELSGAVRELDGQRSLTTTLRAQAHEFSNHLHVLRGLLELGRTADAAALIDRLGGGGRLLSGAGLGAVEDPSVSALLMAKAALARERGAELVVVPATRVPAGAGEDVLTVLGNLVDNALDAAGQGGRVLVDVRGEPGGPWRVVVDDDGPGVPAPLREEVFRVGVTTKDGGDGRHGQGIGLALVARVAARRGGSAAVGTSPLGGARFEVVLGGGSSSPSSSGQLAGAGA